MWGMIVRYYNPGLRWPAIAAVIFALIKGAKLLRGTGASENHPQLRTQFRLRSLFWLMTIASILALVHSTIGWNDFMMTLYYDEWRLVASGLVVLYGVSLLIRLRTNRAS